MGQCQLRNGAFGDIGFSGRWGLVLLEMGLFARGETSWTDDSSRKARRCFTRSSQSAGQQVDTVQADTARGQGGIL